MRGGLALKKRKKKPGEHSSPEVSGIQNLPKHYIERVKGTGGGIMEHIMEIYKKGKVNSREYKGLWDEESLESEIFDYFEFCTEYDVKPAKAGLRLWLGLSKSQYWEWENNFTDYKANLLREASDFMELQYLGKLEKHPTGNIFLLKAGHGYSDKQELEIHSKDVSKEEIGDIVNKMGLNE